MLGKRLQILESPGNLPNSSDKVFNSRCRKYVKTVWVIDSEILGMKEFKVKFGIKNKSEFWKSR